MRFSFLVFRFSLTRGTLAALALLGLAALPQAAQAQGLINFDLTGSGTDAYGPGAAVFGTGTSTWNYRIHTASASSVALTDDTGAATGVTVSYTTSGGASVGSLLTGTFRSLGAFGSETGAVTFTGLTPGGAYDLVIFSGWTGLPSYTVNGTTKTITHSTDWSTLTGGTHYVSFQTIANGSGELSFTPNPNPTGVFGINPWSAFQLLSSSSSAPEPGTLALLALGIAGGVVARRRK